MAVVSSKINIGQKSCSEYFQMNFSPSEMNVILESRAGISMSRILSEENY